MEKIQQGSDSRKNWRFINQLEDERRIHAQLLGIEDDRGTAADQRRPRARVAGMHPFKLYCLPWALRTATSADDWRKFRVRAGRVMGADVTGTDAADDNPDGELFPSVTDIEVPDGTAAYWFWIEISGAAGSVQHSAAPASNGWAGFPIPDETHIPIGYVDTETKSAGKVAIVRQLLRTDVVSVGGGGAGLALAKFISNHDDYIILRPIGEVTDENDFKVAKPYKLRFSISSADIDGITISYSGYNTSLQRRTASAGSVSITQAIVPRYLAEDLIFYAVAPTGVADADIVGFPDIGLIDINADGRAWAKLNPQP